MATSMQSFGFADFDAKPARCNEKVYIIPSKTNKFVRELISKTPDGLTNIRDLGDIDVTSKPNLCVLGLIGLMVRAKGRSLNKDPFLFTLKDFQNADCQVKVTVTESPTKNFPNPFKSLVYLFNPKFVNNDRFVSSSEDVPFSFLIDNNTHGCVIVVNKHLYNYHIEDNPSALITESLLPLIQSSHSGMIPAKLPANLPASKRNRRMIIDSSDEESMSSSKTTRVQASKSPIKKPPKSPKPPSAQVNKKATVYEYTKLKDLKPDKKTKVNIAGVVNYFGEPSESRGKDHYVSFTILDDTVSESINVVAFNSKNKLLVIKEIGNVVLIRHAKVNMYKDAIQVVAPNFTSHHVFGSDSLSPMDSSNNASLSEHDVKTVKFLHEWAVKAHANKQFQIKKLNEVEVGDVFDIVGLVCDMKVIAPDNYILIAITDGTPPQFKTTDCFGQHFPDSRKYPEKYDPLLVIIHITNLHLIKCLITVSLGTYVCIENVYVASENHKLAQGDIVETVHLSVSDEDTSSLSILQESFKNVMEVKKALDEYTSPDLSDESPSDESPSDESPLSPSDESPLSPSDESSLSPSDKSSMSFSDESPLFEYTTFFIFKRMSFTTIKHINDIKDVGPYEFRVDISADSIGEERVEEVMKLCCLRCYTPYPLPKTREELESGRFHKEGDRCSANGCSDTPINKSTPNNTLVHLYYFMLTVSDSTGKLDVCVCKNDALLMFSNIPPGNLYLDKEKCHKILQRIVRIFGYNPFGPKPDNVPVNRMDCGIYLYNMYGSHNTTKTLIIHKIFGTVIVQK